LPADEVPEEAETEPGPIVVENGCGTFELGPHGYSVIPDDPGLPQIVAACDALCSAAASVFADIGGPCTELDESLCLDDCQMRSCDMCPGLLADWADCEARVFSAEACTCTEEGPRCPDALECQEFADRVSACGG